MEPVFQAILFLHIILGSISLVLFWIPVFSQKGGKIHRQAGRWYYRCMWGVLITAGLLCLINAYWQEYVTAAFLGYLVLVTGYPLWYSYEILHQRGDWTPRYFAIRRAFSISLVAASIGMVVLGASFRFEGVGFLMLFFGLLGIPALRDARRSYAAAMEKEQRLSMHIKGTIISGIAAYTAFLAFGGRQILSGLGLPAAWQVLPWILPTIIGVTIIRLMKKKYR